MSYHVLEMQSVQGNLLGLLVRQPDSNISFNYQEVKTETVECVNGHVPGCQYAPRITAGSTDEHSVRGSLHNTSPGVLWASVSVVFHLHGRRTSGGRPARNAPPEGM